MKAKLILGTLILAASAQAKQWDVECEFSYRTSVNVRPQAYPTHTCTMNDSPKDIGSLPTVLKIGTIADKTFNVGVNCGKSLSVGVSQGNQLVSRGLWQTPVNLDNNHGITGLQYVYLPSGAELQYFCKEK